MTTVLADLRELTSSLSAFAAFQRGHFYLPSPHNCTRGEGGAGLADLGGASHFYYREFLLPICEASGLHTIRVDATEGFAITIKHSNLPVMVFSPPVFLNRGAFPRLHFCLGSHFTPYGRHNRFLRAGFCHFRMTSPPEIYSLTTDRGGILLLWCGV
jgi:hypothetical protein